MCKTALVATGHSGEFVSPLLRLVVVELDELARVAAHTNIPIATGERLTTKYEFASVLSKQAAQIIQVDVGQCGGILEAKKIASIAEAHYAMIAPHMYCGPIAAAAAVQRASDEISNGSGDRARQRSCLPSAVFISPEASMAEPLHRARICFGVFLGAKRRSLSPGSGERLRRPR